MDRNSIIGLLLIGGILFAFNIFNSPSQEDIDAAKAKKELNDSIKAAELSAQTEAEIASVKTDTILVDSAELSDTGVVTLQETPNVIAEEQTFTLENDKLKLEFTSKGGHIRNAYIKNYKSYDAYINEREEYLHLLDSSSRYGIDLLVDGKNINTKDFDFTAGVSNDTSLTLTGNINGNTVDFVYTLTNGSHDLNYFIKFNGFNKAAANKTRLLADFKLKSTEKYLLNEQRNATFYYDDEGSYDYMGITGDDDFEFEEKSTWVAFKQLFFSAIVMNDAGFASGSKLEVKQREDSTYLKDFEADLNLGMSNMNETVNLTWYIGPNDYEVLALHGNGSEDIVDLGLGIFRWINVYAFQPVLKAFLGWGIGAGMAILLLTIAVKLVLSPVNYKMYKSSAMMRVLKPEIEEINKKFPKKEDGMKKQQALMALYKDAGASPLAGCVPLLIQMPILIAIFRLFPSSIELRQMPFLWAEDLSTYDQIASWTGDIPLVTWAYGNHISLFTLLMAVTTLLYTHFNSSNMQQPTQEGMPNMKYIMYFFPVMMIFWFNSYSSGLSFYYFISTLMTMGIMFAIKQFMLDEDKIHAKMQANKAAPKKNKGKSKFAQRLEEAQRLQQERAKNKR